MAALECNCLLCTDLPNEGSWDLRDRRIAKTIREYGWNVMGVNGDTTPDWAYSIGLWHSYRSPEICIFGLPNETAMEIINIVGSQIRDGNQLKPDQRRADVLDGYDVAIRPVHPSWYHSFFGAAIDFYSPPLPIVQVFWPDRQGLFPWEPNADSHQHDRQPHLWVPLEEQQPNQWTRLDPYAGWPFRTSLPFTEVTAAQDVVDGAAPIVTVIRTDDGAWQFTGARGGTYVVTVALRNIVDTHPYITDIADLNAGERADRNADGTWARTPSG